MAFMTAVVVDVHAYMQWQTEHMPSLSRCHVVGLYTASFP
jgi:hypothetical protein